MFLRFTLLGLASWTTPMQLAFASSSSSLTCVCTPSTPSSTGRSSSPLPSPLMRPLGECACTCTPVCWCVSVCWLAVVCGQRTSVQWSGWPRTSCWRGSADTSLQHSLKASDGSLPPLYSLSLSLSLSLSSAAIDPAAHIDPRGYDVYGGTGLSLGLTSVQLDPAALQWQPTHTTHPTAQALLLECRRLLMRYLAGLDGAIPSLPLPPLCSQATAGTGQVWRGCQWRCVLSLHPNWPL